MGLDGTLIIAFVSFHLWLMAKGMTTIEFCETRYAGHRHMYDKGAMSNVKTVLGHQPLGWFLPIAPPSEEEGACFSAVATVARPVLPSEALERDSAASTVTESDLSPVTEKWLDHLSGEEAGEGTRHLIRTLSGSMRSSQSSVGEDGMNSPLLEGTRNL